MSVVYFLLALAALVGVLAAVIFRALSSVPLTPRERWDLERPHG